MSAPEFIQIVLGVCIPFVGGYSFGYIFGKEAERADGRRFVKGRLRFVGARYNAPFPCAVVVFRRARPTQETPES